MTLRDKFLNSPCEKGYINTNIYRAENNVKIADDFAIEFAEWCDNNYFRMGNTNIWSESTDWENNTKLTTKELLEIFKKEKGL